MDVLAKLVVAFAISVVLSIAAHRLRMLTAGGACAALFVGYIVGLFGSLEWLLVLTGFTAAGLAATRISLGLKLGIGLEEDAGERTHRNVLGVGMPPCAVAVAYTLVNHFIGARYNDELTVAFLCTITVAAADTMASEIGIRDVRVWLITSFKRVRRGTDGGVSPSGMAAALAGSAVSAVIGWSVFFGGLDARVAIPFAAGVAGCLLDSVLGATVESKGLMSKYANNCVTAMAGAAIGTALFYYLG
ncbi:MAG: DUF92 domain-containing protein [Candidatus Methanoplasma sp.]|jgi:uncharacterized protein (TIGR00297 family)|nr:DUF92 domain-containing protein [Candidatus Methanoplasma sp.]